MRNLIINTENIKYDIFINYSWRVKYFIVILLKEHNNFSAFERIGKFHDNRVD